MGRGGYIVEGVWERDGRLYVQLVMRRVVLSCRLAQVTNSSRAHDRVCLYGGIRRNAPITVNSQRFLYGFASLCKTD